MTQQNMKLNDTSVRMDNPNHKAEYPYIMARCLVSLFDVPSIIDEYWMADGTCDFDADMDS